MIFAAHTDVGRRISNEDSLLLPAAGHSLPLLAVADGLGGHAAGKRASGLAVNGLDEFLLRETAADFANNPLQHLRQTISKINLDIYQHALAEPGCRGMGTTLTLALLFEDEYIVANVGDSRLYHYDGWTLTQVTHDHSLVAVLVANGEITPAEAYVHPRRNIITRALGTSPSEEADYFQRRWAEGDTLLLCSDGLHGSLPDAEIERLLHQELPLQEVAEALVQAALDAGATDNITALLARNTGGERA